MKYRLLHNIGDLNNPNYNTREEILKCNDILTIDGIYKNIHQNRDILKNRQVILFIMGDYVGKDNSFDKKMPREQLCDWNELMELKDMGCELGWHTYSHRDLTKLSTGDILKEIIPPFPMKYFAYPYGKVNEKVEGIVRSMGYEKAFCAGHHGNNTNFQIQRKYL